MTTFKDPREAFTDALERGLLSRDRNSSNYVHNFMYMGTTDGVDEFKHIMTRRYIS